MNRDQKDLLAPFADRLEAIYADVDRLTDAELERLRTGCVAATDSNCAWSTFRAARMVLVAIQEAQAYRASRAKSKAATP